MASGVTYSNSFEVPAAGARGRVGRRCALRGRADETYRRGAMCVTCSAAHLGRGVVHRGVDLDVFATAANVARERLGDLLVARLRVRLQQRVGRHDEAARADAALEAAIFPERALDRVQALDAPARGQRCDRQDLLTAAEPRRETVQPLTARPSTTTVHAPHCARSQPRFELAMFSLRSSFPTGSRARRRSRRA